MATNKTQCFICNKNKITYLCKGCSKEFCSTDLSKHKDLLVDELNLIINDYDQFKQRINEQHKAQEYREIIIKYSQTCINNIELKFNDLSEQIKQLQQDNEFNETDLEYLRNQLMKITQELNNPSKPKFNKWKQNGITVAGGNEHGQQLNKLSGPAGIFVDKNKNIFIADRWNDRIVEWKYNAKQGQIIAGGNFRGNQMDQLNRPTDVIVDQKYYSIIIADHGNRRVIQWGNKKQQILINNIDCVGLAIDKHGFIYVSNNDKNEVRRWKMGEYNNEGLVVAGENGQGNQFSQLNRPTFIFVDEEQAVYVSDQNNHRVMKWRKDAKEGIVVAGGNLNQLYYPEGIIVDHLGQIYVAYSGNHRVMGWCEGKEEGEIVVGRYGQGNQPNQLNKPTGLSF
ncbi:unnamed protein product, partial [Adineta steineri]